MNTAILTLAVLAAHCSCNEGPCVEDVVDRVEVNHYYGDDGSLVFDQVIFYDWCPIAERFQVRAWRLLKTPAQRPLKDVRRGGYVVVWHDGDVLRRVRAKSYRESWTQYDPEMRERDHLNPDKRKELLKPRVSWTAGSPSEEDLELYE